MKWRLYILMIISVVMMSACHDDTPSPQPQQKAHRTILFYLPYSGTQNNLYDYFMVNIQDIERAIKHEGGTGDNRVVYFVAKNHATSYLIDVRYTSGEIVRDTLSTVSYPDFTTADGISKILFDVKKKAPADKYAMMVGCHGEGWIPADNGLPAKHSRFFGSGSNGYQTDMAAMAQALKMADMRLEYMLMDVCYMACIENAYNLRDVCQMFIASATEIMNYGMPYEDIFKYLMQHEPDYEAVCQKYLEFYADYADGFQSLPYGTLSVTNCSQLDNIAQIMRRINTQYDATLTSDELNDIQDLDAAHHSPTIYFDFGDYVEHLHIGDAIKAECKTLLDMLVPYRVSTPQIFSYFPYQVIDVKTFSGLTISDPSVSNMAINAKHDTEWWQATH